MSIPGNDPGEKAMTMPEAWANLVFDHEPCADKAQLHKIGAYEPLERFGACVCEVGGEFFPRIKDGKGKPEVSHSPGKG